MIHLIYIYFIVNAFMAGVGLEENKKTAFLLLFFGCFIAFISISWSVIRKPIIWVENRFLLLGWYRLLFTAYFSKMDCRTVEIRRAQYQGKTKNINANRYQRFFLRQLDKKYNYGITKEKI